MKRKFLCVLAWSCCFLLLFTTACPNNDDDLPVSYEITGNIKVTNDCDGQLDSIPNNVWVETALMNADGTVSIPGRTMVNLAPDPADPLNPVKIGNYSITLQWTKTHEDVGGAATAWQYPQVKDQPNGTEICLAFISCPPGTGPCHNMATGPDVPAANPPWPTGYDIEVVCGCN